MTKSKKKEKRVESPLPKKMTKKRLEKLMNMFCIHIAEYERGDCLAPDVKCDACILRDIPWIQNVQAGDKIEHLKKDLCFAVWHVGVLKKNA